jgi:Ser/Thr protein kinase RdoA (MazF antagonist)
MDHVGRLTEAARAAYGWDADVRITPGPRGALGQIWRVDTGGRRYALKEFFADPPSAAFLDAELTFAARAAAAGVRLPASLPDRSGRHLVSTVDEPWLRLADWVDLSALALTPDTARAVGAVLARLHRCAAAVSVEPDGEPPHPWYDTFPPVDAFAGAAASASPWAATLRERLADHAALTAPVTPVDPARLVMCHRDLHPENILAGPDGAPVVVDWDNLGPADPARELVKMLFDWFGDSLNTDLDAMRVLYRAYVDEGGPARITDPADFSMLICARLNFLRKQIALALDPATVPRHREWAEREIVETLRWLPTPQRYDAVLALVRPIR